MKRLYIHLIKAFTQPFILTFVLAMIVLILNFVWLYIDELVGKGLSINDVLELFSYLCIQLVPLALILGVLLASIMTFGQLGESNELTAIKSSGISLTKTMKPIFFLVLLISLGSLAFSHYITPYTNNEFFKLMHDIQKQSPEFNIKEAQFYNGIEDYSLYIGEKNTENNIIYDIMIYDHSDKRGNVFLTRADSGRMRITESSNFLILDLYNGYNHIEQLTDEKEIYKTKKLRKDRFNHQQLIFDLPGTELTRSGDDLYRNLYLRLNLSQLRDTARAREEEMHWRTKIAAHQLLETQYLKYENKKEVRENPRYYQAADNITNPYKIITSLSVPDQREIFSIAQSCARNVKDKLLSTSENNQTRIKGINTYKNEWHRKISMAAACLIFFLIGAPLGAVIKKGGFGSPVLISIMLFIVFHILSKFGEKYARVDIIPSWLGMWGALIIILPIAVLLTIRSNNDNRLISLEKINKYCRQFFASLRLR